MFQEVRAASIAGALLACFLLATSASAQTIDHSNGFGSHSDLVANTNDDPGTPPREVFFFDTLQLTAGTNGNKTSVFSVAQVNASSFVTSFLFEIRPTSSPPADGFAFVIQNDPRGAMAIGPGGGGLAYGADHPGPVDPLAIVRSVAIKFDIFVGNPCETLGPSTTGLFVDGHSPTCPTPDTKDAYFDTRPAVALHTGGLFFAELYYDGFTLTEGIVNLSTGEQFTTSYNVDIVSHLGGAGTANVGFTAATGGLNFEGYIYSWRWDS